MHPNAKTNKKIRSYIQGAQKTVAELAIELGVSRVTIRKWKKRSTVEDKSHAVINVSKKLDVHEEKLIIFLRELLNLSVDDMLILCEKIFCFKTSRAGLGRLVKRNNFNKPALNEINTKDRTKLIIFHSENFKPEITYIIVANTKTKILHISWVERRDTGLLYQQIFKSLSQFQFKNVLLAEESNDYQYYLNNLSNICVSQEFIFEQYSEKGLVNISPVQLINTIRLISTELVNTKHHKLHFAFRAFRFIYNHKIHLRSLRQKTPRCCMPCL